VRPARAASIVQAPRFGDDWWQRGVVYQVYPRSFADTTGDGVGDLPGIIEHLDHLGPDGLGIDALWLSPIYPSPALDLGYDVSDHERVDPLFGSEADFDRLVTEAHRRGIRVVLDLVMNHTSDAHRWFVASRTGRSGEYADWYLWADPAGTEPDGTRRPPNNWVSFFGGPGWHWEPRREQFYYHTFLTEQPEMNWRAPGVEAAQFEMVRGWLARGVDGFRLDVFNTFLKDPELRSNPTRPGRTAWDRQVHLYDRDQPDFPALIGRFRAILDETPGRMSVGELFDESVETAASFATDRHLVFDWALLEASWTAPAIRSAIAEREGAFGATRWPTAVLSNHDRSRQATRLPASIGVEDTDAIARAAAVLLLTQRGTAFLYYGEELGLRDVDVPAEASVDTPAGWIGPDFEWWDRSRSRTPMPWTGGAGAGFTTGRPWLPLGPDADTRNVAAQRADPGSVLDLYRRVIALRAAHPALQVGDLRLEAEPIGDVVAYSRSTADEGFLIVLNLGRDRVTWRLPELVGWAGWRPTIDTAGRAVSDVVVAGGGTVDLEPDQALVLEGVR
jgi:alpha-glucosidase